MYSSINTIYSICKISKKTHSAISQILILDKFPTLPFISGRTGSFYHPSPECDILITSEHYRHVNLNMSAWQPNTHNQTEKQRYSTTDN